MHSLSLEGFRSAPRVTSLQVVGRERRLQFGLRLRVRVLGGVGHRQPPRSTASSERPSPPAVGGTGLAAACARSLRLCRLSRRFLARASRSCSARASQSPGSPATAVPVCSSTVLAGVAVAVPTGMPPSPPRRSTRHEGSTLCSYDRGTPIGCQGGEAYPTCCRSSLCLENPREVLPVTRSVSANIPDSIREDAPPVHLIPHALGQQIGFGHSRYNKKQEVLQNKQAPKSTSTVYDHQAVANSKVMAPGL